MVVSELTLAPKVCKTMAFMAIILGLGRLCCILLRFKYRFLQVISTLIINYAYEDICHAQMGWAEGSAFAGSGNRQGTIPSKKKEHFEPPLVEACGEKGTTNCFLNWRGGGG